MHRKQKTLTIKQVIYYYKRDINCQIDIIYLLYEMSNKTGPMEDEFQLDIHTEYLYVYIFI